MSITCKANFLNNRRCVPTCNNSWDEYYLLQGLVEMDDAQALYRRQAECVVSRGVWQVHGLHSGSATGSS